MSRRLPLFWPSLLLSAVILLSPTPAFSQNTSIPVTLRLTDGSTLHGQSANMQFSLQLPYGRIGLRLDNITQIRFRRLSPSSRSVRLRMQNGDTLTGKLELNYLHLTSLLGDLDVPVRSIERLHVHSLPATPIAYFPLDGSAKDESGHSHHGTVRGATAVSDRHDTPNSAYRFENDAHINLGDTFNDVTVPFSIAAWIYREPEGNGAILNADASLQFPSSLYTGFTLKIQESKLQVGFSDGQGTGPAHMRAKRSFQEIPERKWVHIVGVAKGPRDMQLYLNGKEIEGSYVGAGGPLAHNQRPTLISRRFVGRIDDVLVYDRALTAQDVQHLYEKP